MTQEPVIREISRLTTNKDVTLVLDSDDDLIARGMRPGTVSYDEAKYTFYYDQPWYMRLLVVLSGVLGIHGYSPTDNVDVEYYYATYILGILMNSSRRKRIEGGSSDQLIDADGVIWDDITPGVERITAEIGADPPDLRYLNTIRYITGDSGYTSSIGVVPIRFNNTSWGSVTNYAPLLASILRHRDLPYSSLEWR
jgi:hypothetical protein